MISDKNVIVRISFAFPDVPKYSPKPEYLWNCKICEQALNAYLSAIHLQSEQTSEIACRIRMPIGRLW